MSDITEKEASIAYARAWNSSNCSSFSELLKADAVYKSIYLKEEITSKDKILAFLEERIGTLNQPEHTIYVDLGRTTCSPPVRDCALMCKNGEIRSLVKFEIEDGLIISFENDHSFVFGPKATNTYPGLEGDPPFRIRNRDEFDPDRAELARAHEGKLCLFREKYIFSLIQIEEMKIDDWGVSIRFRWIEHMGGAPHDNVETHEKVGASWEFFNARTSTMSGSYAGWSIYSEASLIDKLKEFYSTLDPSDDPMILAGKMAYFMDTLPTKEVYPS